VLMEEEYVFDEHEPSLANKSTFIPSDPARKDKLTPWATVEKNPFSTLAVIKLSKLVAAAHQAAVKKAKITKKNNTGRRPKYAARIIVANPPGPSINTFPACE
jgi:hypothetical protein